MNNSVNMPDWHQYNPSQSGISDVTANGQNVNSSHLTFVSTIGPPALNGYNVTAEGFDKHQNDTNFNSRHFQSLNSVTNVPNGTNNNPLTSMVQMQNCIGHYGSSGARNALGNLSGPIDPRNSSINALNEELGYRNNQIPMKGPVNHLSGPNLNVSGNNGSVLPRHNSVNSTHSRQGPPSFIPCKGLCCNPDPNISYQQWDKYPPYQTNASYRDNIRSSGYQSENRRFGNEVNFRKDTYDNKEMLGTIPPNTDHRRNYPDYTKYCKDSMVSRTYPTSSGMLQNYTMQNYNYTGDYQKYSYPVKDYSKVSGMNFPNTSMLKHQEQNFINQQKYNNKQGEYQNGAIMPKGICAANMNSNVMPPVQNSYFNSQIPRNISTEISHECQEATDTSMMTRMPCSPMHGNHARFQTYQQKIAMQRFSMESRLRELARIPGYQSHPKYKECILRYSEILKLQQSVGYSNTVQQTARVSTPVTTTVPPINLQFDQNGVLIHSNYLSDGFSRLAQIPNSEISSEISGKHSQEQVIDTSQMKNQSIQHTEQLNSSQNHRSPTLCAENLQQNHDNFSIRKNVEQQNQFKSQKNNTNIYNDLSNGSSNVATREQKISKNFADKPELDVRQFLANWDESEDEEGSTSHLPEVNLNDSNQIVVAVNYDNPEASSERSTETEISKRDNFGSTDPTYENQDNNAIGVITPNCLTVSYSSAENKESSPSCCEELATESIIKSGDIIHCISNGPDEIPTIHIVDNLEINNILEVTGEPVIKVLEGQESMSYFEQTAHMGASTSSIERDQLRKDEASKRLTVYRPPLDNLNKDTYINDVSDTAEKISSSVQQVDAQEIEVLPMSSKSSLDSSQGFRKQNSFTSEESHNPDDISLPDLPTSECTPISTTLNTPIHSDSEESSEQVEDLTISTNPIEVIQNSPMISFTHSPIKMDPYEHLDTIQGAKNKADISIASSFHEGGQVKRNDMEHKTSEQVGVNRFDTSDKHNYDKTVERNANLSNRKISTSDDIQNQVNSVNVCLSPTSSEYDIRVTLVNAPQEITQDKDCDIENDINEQQISINSSAVEQYNQSSTSTSSKTHSENKDLHKSRNNKSELTLASHSNCIYMNRTNIPKQLGPTKRVSRPEILTPEMSKHPAKLTIATAENQLNSTNCVSSKENIIEDVKIKNSESKRDCPMTLVKEISMKTNKQNVIEANQQQAHDRQQFIVSTTTENTNKEVEKSLHTIMHEKTYSDASRKKTDHSSKESRVSENIANKKDCGKTIKEYKKTKTKMLYTSNCQNKKKQSNIISQHITESVNKSFADVDEQLGKSVSNDQLIEDAAKIESQESQQISKHAISLQQSPLPAVSYSIGIEDQEQQKKCAFSKSFVRNNPNSDFEIQVTNVNLKIKENDIRKELLNFRDKHQESVSETMDAIKIHINVSCADRNTKEEILPENAMSRNKQEVANCDISISGNVDTSTQNARNLHVSTFQENNIEDQIPGSSLDESNKNMLLENCSSTTQCCTVLNTNKDNCETSMEHNILQKVHCENDVDNTKTQQENFNTNLTKQTVTVVNVKHVEDGLYMNKVCHRALQKDAAGEVMQCTNAHESTVEGSKSVKMIENISKREIPFAVNKKNSELQSLKVVETNCPNAPNKLHKDTYLNSPPSPMILSQTQNKAVLDSFSLQPLLHHADVQNSETKDVNAISHISPEVKKLEGNRRCTSSPVLNITEISTESVNCDGSINLDFDHFDIAPNENIDSEQVSKHKNANMKRKFSDMQLYNCSSGYVNPIFTSLEELENLNTIPVYTTKDGKITYSPNPRFTYRELILEARQREGHSSLRGSCYTNTLINDIHVSPKHKFLKKRYSFHTSNKKRQTLVSSGKKFCEQALKYYNTREDNDENHRNYIHCVTDHSATHLEYYNNEADRKYNKNDYQGNGFNNKRHVLPSSTHGKKKEHTDDTRLNSKWERHKISHNLLLEKRNRKYVASETGLLLGNKGVRFDGSVESIAVHALCNDKGKSQWNFLNSSIPECSKKQDDLSRNLTRKPYFNISELIPSYKICSPFDQNTCSLKNDATEMIDLHKTSTCPDKKIEGIELSNSIINNNNNRNDNDNNTNDTGITMNMSEGGGSLKEEKHNIVNTTYDNILSSEFNIAQGLFETTDHGFQKNGVVHIQNEELVIRKVEIGNSNPDIKNKKQSDLNDSQKKGCEKYNDNNDKNHEYDTSKYTLHNTENILSTSHAISEDPSKRIQSIQSVDTDYTSCKGNNGLNVTNSALSESVVKDNNVEYSNFDADETNLVPEMQREDTDNLNDSTNVLNIDSTHHNNLQVSSQKILSQKVNIQLEEIEHIKNVHVDQFLESKISNNCLINFHTDIEQSKCDNQYCISNGNKCECSIVKTSECMLQNLHTSQATISEILLTKEIVKTDKHVNESIGNMLTCEKVQFNEFSRTSNMGLLAKNSLSTQNQLHDSDNKIQYDIIEKQIIKKDITVDMILEKEKFCGNSVSYADEIIDMSANCSIPLASKNKCNEDNQSYTTSANFAEGTFKVTEVCTPIDKGSLNVTHNSADLATLDNKININIKDPSVMAPLTNSELLDAKITASIQSRKELHTMVNKLQDVKKYTKLKSDLTSDCYPFLPNELDSLNDKNLLCNTLNKESSPYIYIDKNKHGPDTVSYDCNTKIVPKLVIKKTEINSNLVTLSSCDDEQNKNSEVGLKSAVHPKIPKMIIRNARSRPGTPMIEEVSESTSLKNQKIDHSIFEIRRQVSNDDYANKSDIVQESILLESKVPKVKIKLGNKLLKQSETCKQMEISVKRKSVKKAIPKVKIKKIKTQFKDNIDSEHNPAPVTIRTELLNKALKITSIVVDEISNEDSEHKDNESPSENDRIYSNEVTSNCNNIQAMEKDNNCSSHIDKDKLEVLLTDNAGRKWEKMPRVKFRKEVHNCLSCSDTRQSESITEIPSKRYRKSAKEDTRTMRNSGSIEMASIHNMKKEHVLCISEKIPKVIIKRSSASSEFKCELSKDVKNAIVKSAKWQPEVKLQRSQMLDHMVKNLKYSTVGLTSYKKKDISFTHCSKPENIFDCESCKFGNKLCRSSSTSDLSPIKYKQRRMSDYNHSKFKDTETFSNKFCSIKTDQISSNKANTFGNIWSKENKSDNGDESHTCENDSKNCVEKHTSCDEVMSNENEQHLQISDKTVSHFQDSCSTSNLCDEEVAQVLKGRRNCFVLNSTSDEIVSSTSPSANNNIETLKSVTPKSKDTSKIICSIPNPNDLYFAKSNIFNNAKQVILTESENQLFIDQNKKVNTLSLNGILSITQGIKDENLPSKSVFECHNNHTIVEESILSEYNGDSVSNLEDGIKTNIVPLSHHFNNNDDSVIKVDSSDESQTTIEILPASPDVNQIEISTCQLADVSEQLYSEDAIPTQFELELEVTDNSNVDFLDVPIPRVAEVPYHSTDVEYAGKLNTDYLQNKRSSANVNQPHEKYLKQNSKLFTVVADGEDANIHCTLSYDISTKNQIMESYDGLNFANTENCDKKREDQPKKTNTKFLCCNDLFIKEVLAAKETLKKCFTKSKDENKKTNIARPKTAAEKKQGSSFDLNSHTFTELNNTNHMYQSIPEVNPNVKLSASNQYKTELKPNVEKSDDRHSKQVKSSLMKKRIQVTNELDNNAGAEYSSMSFKSGLTTADEVTTISLKAFKRFGYDLVEKPTDIMDKNKILNKDNCRSHNLYNSVHIEKQIVQDIKEDTRIHKLPKISNCSEENNDTEETTKEIKSKEDNMPVLEPEVAVNFDPSSDRDSSRSPPVITNQDGIQANVELKDSEEKVIMADDKRQRSKKYSDRKCEMTFADIVTQLAYHEKATIKHRRYCTLCERWFPTTSRHRRHLAGYQHRHIELTQRRTIHALFMLFTGRHCPRLLPTNIVRTDYTIGEPTPLQMAVQDVVKCLDPIQHDLNKHDNADI